MAVENLREQGSIVENLTLDELLAWVNGLGICTFKKIRRFDHDVAICEKGQVHILLGFGRFAIDDRSRFVTFSVFDNRLGNFSGMSAPLETLEEVKRYIEIYAERLGLANPQMRLF